jgi:hypothetical protein
MTSTKSTPTLQFSGLANKASQCGLTETHMTVKYYFLAVETSVPKQCDWEPGRIEIV